MSMSKSSTNTTVEAHGEVRDNAIAELKAALAQLASRVAQLDPTPVEWRPLKDAALGLGLGYERARQWAVRGLIEARMDGGRWLVNVASLRARAQRFS